MEKDEETWAKQRARIEREITTHRPGDVEFSATTNTEANQQWIAQELASNHEQEINFTAEIDTSVYEIDFDKVNTVEDIKELLKVMNFRFTAMTGELEDCIHLLKKSKF